MTVHNCLKSSSAASLSSLFFFLGCICLLTALLPTPLTLIFFLSAVLHECGHISAMVLLGIPIRGFRAACGGAVLHGDMQTVSYHRELLAAAAGPAVNVLLAVLSSHIMWTYSREVCLLNLLLACYNLLPLDGNDGAVMLGAVGELFGFGAWMRRCLGWLSAVLLAVLVMMSAWIMWYGALSDPGGITMGYGALFFCILLRMQKNRSVPKPEKERFC